MNRSKKMKASASIAASLAPITYLRAGADDKPFRPTALKQSGTTRLSTFEAVKAISSNKAAPILPEVAEYFQHYGANYALKGEWTPEQAASYARFLQRSLNDRETGTLSLEQASYLLTRKRCGRPDPTPAQLAASAQRWKYTNPSWFPDPAMRTNLEAEAWVPILRKAWAAWQAVSTLTPTQSFSAKGANCTHSSGSGRTDGFDGPSGVLAWAELPPTPNYTGTLVNLFDGAEQWTVSSDERSIRALNVATHEIGHLLGLEHSSDPSALMAPFYDPSVPSPVQDDIRRIRLLYPVAALPPDSPGGPSLPPDNPNGDPGVPGPVPGPVDPNPGPCGRRPRWFPALPRLFPRRRGVC